MENLTHYPVLVFAAAFVSLSLASESGAWLRRRYSGASDERNEALSVILGATLTLLALIIGFSFSMATNRYDQRKNFEEAEANAIGTELLRADLLPPTDASSVRKLLGEYLNQRIMFFINKDDVQRTRIDERIGQLETDLWAAVRVPAQAQPTPIAALVLAGMNDVINSQGYTQAAYWNRIPTAAWCLMAAIALCSNVLFGYRVRNAGKLSLVLPLVVSISFTFDRRYRCSAAWPDSRQSAEPGKSGEVTWALKSIGTDRAAMPIFRTGLVERADRGNRIADCSGYFDRISLAVE